jgi:8-oxo-dGTP diphosphatase
MALTRAAGGVVWRDARDGRRRLAVIHRPGHDDWSLPKGKLDRGEPWHRAALREVVEETGCAARLTSFAGAKLFVARRVPKLVLYWHMSLVRESSLEPNEEVDELAWLTPRDALSRFDHASDRRLLLRVLSGGAQNRGSGERGTAPSSGRDALRQLLVVDQPCPERELAPFVRLIETALEEEAVGPRRQRVL